MGCSVNGIGEALKADVALYGTKDEAIIYKNGHKYKVVPHKLAFAELTKIIK
jgi:4-hydroxy-3-methylbut-2-en-1-yl diphosphate synthase IspG/GcpE